MHILLVVEIFLILLAPPTWAAGRCEQYRQEVRRAHFHEFGTDFPWWYAVGQLRQESNCRDVISNDGIGSQGLPQITWKVWKKYLQAHGVESLGTTTNQLRAQALINRDAYNQTTKPKKLWVTWQIYNGGGLVKKEIAKAGCDDWAAARAQCQRKVITFSTGQKIDACDINYDYSQKIYKYGDEYRLGEDSPAYPYW